MSPLALLWVVIIGAVAIEQAGRELARVIRRWRKRRGQR